MLMWWRILLSPPIWQWYIETDTIQTTILVLKYTIILTTTTSPLYLSGLGLCNVFIKVYYLLQHTLETILTILLFIYVLHPISPLLFNKTDSKVILYFFVRYIQQDYVIYDYIMWKLWKIFRWRKAESRYWKPSSTSRSPIQLRELSLCQGGRFSAVVSCFLIFASRLSFFSSFCSLVPSEGSPRVLCPRLEHWHPQ